MSSIISTMSNIIKNTKNIINAISNIIIKTKDFQYYKQYNKQN